MTLPRKDSRLIIINGEKFRWTVGPNDGFNVLVVEKEGAKASRILVYFDTDINKFWIEFPNMQGLNLKIVKPRDVEFIIREALAQQWNPGEIGELLVFDLIGDRLIKRDACG